MPTKDEAAANPERCAAGFDFEAAVAQWRDRTRRSGISCPLVLDELETHLREEADRQTASGLAEQPAFEEALQRLGDAESLAGEFEKVDRLKQTQIMKTPIRFFSLTGWLIPTGIAVVYFSRWITEIIIPTLKGGNFDRLYDAHNVPYLHVTIWSILIAFAWVAAIALSLAKKQSVSKPA